MYKRLFIYRNLLEKIKKMKLNKQIKVFYTFAHLKRPL